VESTSDFVDDNDDDVVSETSSEDFDTTLRPQDASSDQEVSAVNNGTGFLMRESLDTIRPGTSLIPVTSSDRSRPIVKKATSAFPVISGAYSTSENPLPVPPLSFGHATRRKPVPRLEDYDRLFPARPQPRTVATG